MWAWYKGSWAFSGPSPTKVSITTYYRNAAGAWVYWQSSPLLAPTSAWNLASFTSAPLPAGRLIQTGHREPPHHAHRRIRVPHRAVEQPLGPQRRPIPGTLRDRPPIAPGQVTGQRDVESHTCL